MAKARPVNETEAPELFRVVRDLARKAQLPMPRVYRHGMARLFATHPPVEERVARLEKIAGAVLG